MGRLAWSQVRFRLARTVALVAGVLVAATAFTVLTAASQTAQARTVGKVSANAASRRALNGGDLLPSQNIGGLVSQPVNLITTLSALPSLENGHNYKGVPAADPISVIRVKVTGVTGPGALSRERINAVAQQIEQRTGLDVDVVAGSSPSPVTIDVPAGRFGQPPLTLTQNWVKEGVAVAILRAVDKTSVALYILILVVCGLFVANAATAAVRGRRRELGVLAAVGWRRSRLSATILGELAGIGLAAGLLAAAVSVPVSAALGLDASPARALLAGRAHQPRGITSLALLNVARTPGRTSIGVVSLAVGIAALTMLTAVARLLAIAAVAVVAGVLITAVAALLPAALLRRLPTAQLLAEE